MEKKKLLLVTISVGIFLVIAIGAAILVFTPKNTAASPNAAINRGNRTDNSLPSPSPDLSSLSAPESVPDNSGPVSSVDAVEMVRNSQDLPGLKPPPEGTIRQGSNFYINGSDQSGHGISPETVISVPKPSTAAVPDASTPARTPPASQSSQAAPKPAAAPAPKTAAPAASASKPAVQTRIYDDYWVQTGAFSVIASAEGVKDTLASKGITSIIENRDINGKTMFRVRVGPYTSKNEADYWLSLIKSISGFEDSQIRQTQSRR